MTVTEALHRTMDVVRRTLWTRRQVPPGAPLPRHPAAVAERRFLSPLPTPAEFDLPAETALAVVEAADRVLSGTWSVLGVRRKDSAHPDWFFDPVTGRRAPDRQLAFRVHHRNEAKTGNIKQVWELSRHHHLTVLATAWWLTEQDRYSDAVAAQLRSWWTANPFLTGVHWTSGIEAGVRLISWAWIRRLLDTWPKVGDLFEHNEDAVTQIGWHQEFLAAFPSRGSSANNHVVAEAAGAVVAACEFPWYRRSDAWRAAATELLETELAANTFGDGLNRELATDYHRFVLELGLVAAVEADAAGHPLSEETWAHLTNMADAAAAIVDVSGRPPRQGDGDEGRAVVLDDPDADPWSVALSTGAALLGSPDWWPPLNGSVQASLAAALARPRRPFRPTQRPRLFAEAGVALLRSRPSDGPEIWCRCDGGPHGFLSIAAHAHADALSIEVRHEGVDIFADPGTYCYHGEPEWRQWFRSTAAHNTVEVGGVSQSEPGGPFLWNTHARTTILGCDLGDQPVQTWSAEHDGYQRLALPVGHRRSVALDSPGRRLTITDWVDAARAFELVLRWHLGPDVQVVLDGSTAVLSWPFAGNRRRGRLALPRGLAWSCQRGATDPIEGWYSPGFGERTRASTLVGRGTVDARATLVSELELP
jgi:hypothetical protein